MSVMAMVVYREATGESMTTKAIANIKTMSHAGRKLRSTAKPSVLMLLTVTRADGREVVSYLTADLA